jgi:hypothetical protein
MASGVCTRQLAVVCLALLPCLGTTLSCTSSSQNLTYNSQHNRYEVRTNADLLQLRGCDELDYLWVVYCASCTQADWEQLQITAITGVDPFDGDSVVLHDSPGITNMAGLANLGGSLAGSLAVWQMQGIQTLDGLEGVTGVGTNSLGWSILLMDNPELRSALALGNARGEGTVSIINNTNLVCVPNIWPERDDNGHTIRQGPCCEGGTCGPTATPTGSPTTQPTVPTAEPTSFPTELTTEPTATPTGSPTELPSAGGDDDDGESRMNAAPTATGTARMVLCAAAAATIMTHRAWLPCV